MLVDSNENPVLNERWLRWANFWVNYRERIKIGVIIVVATIEAVMLVYSAYVLLDYFVISAERDRATEMALTRSMNVEALHKAMAPRPISTPIVAVLSGSAREGRHGVLIRFSNPNTKWVATVNYQIGNNTDESVTLLNSSERFVVSSTALSSAGEKPSFVVTGVQWKRLRNADEINNLKPRFVVSDVRFTSARRAKPNGVPPPSQVSFTVTNESIFSFWEVEFAVVLLRGEQPVAARQFTINEFRSAEQREVVSNIFTTLGSVSDVLVVPFVNVLDEGVFMREVSPLIRF